MRRDRETGFTLVELLVAISILAIISYPLTESVIQALRTTDATARRFGESIDAQSLAASFGPDVQSSDQVAAPFVADPADPCTAGSGTPVLLLRWTDGSVAKQASYMLETAGSERHLVRRYCEADSRIADPPVVKLVHQHDVASLVPLNLPEAVVTCADAHGPLPACSAQPAQVTMTLTYPRPPLPDETFEAVGTRRAR